MHDHHEAEAAPADACAERAQTLGGVTKACADYAAKDAQRDFCFASALLAIKKGFAVSRRNWNGPGQFVYLNRGSADLSPRDNGAPIGGVPVRLFNTGDRGTTTRMPNLNLRTTRGDTITGWAPSQTDLLAEDWFIS